MAVDEQAGPQAGDEGEGLQEPFGGAFAGEWLSQVGHEHVAGEQHAARREVDHQRVWGFPARRRVQDKLGAPGGQRRRLADQLVGDDGRGDTPGGSGEVAEQGPVTLLTVEPGGKTGLGDHPGAGPAQRGRAADVVPVRVGEDQMADRTVSRQVKVAERGLDPILGRSGVDRDNAVAGRDEREVGEVVALGDLDTGFRAQDPGRGEAEPVLGGRPEAAEHQLGAGRGGAEPGLAHRLGGLVIVAQHGMGRGEAVVRGAQQHGRELVGDGQDELQVGHGASGPPPVRRQPGQGQPAEVLRQAKIGGRGLVQLGQRGVHIFAQPCLEKPGERERQRLTWLGAGRLGEVAVPLGVRAGSREPGGEDDRGGAVGARPAGRYLE